MKKKVLPIVTISVLGAALICSIFPAIAIGNRNFLNGKSLASIDTFLDNDITIDGHYFDTDIRYFHDEDNAIKNYLKSITFEDDNNKFPYGYHGDHAYAEYVLHCNSRVLRFNKDLTKCALSYSDEGNHFEAVMEYNLKDCDANHLSGLIKSARRLEDEKSII